LLSVGTASVVDVPETTHGAIAAEVITVKTEETEAITTSPVYNNVETLVRTYFSDIPIMAEIARCESTFRHHLGDGSILRGRVDQRDTGVMQINTYYHQVTADELGLDLEDFYHNMAYARYLYERQGVQPWSASQPCWGATQLAMR
jgi:hypothetical protein